MAKHTKPWSQQTQKEKVESLRIRQQRIANTLNLLARLIEPVLSTPSTRKETDHEIADANQTV